MTLRIISGAIGLAILAGTFILALNLAGMERDARVYLAGYMGIGGVLIGGYLVLYAISGRKSLFSAGSRRPRRYR